MFEYIVKNSFEKMTIGRYLRTYCGVSARTLAKLKRTEDGILLNKEPSRAVDYVKLGDEITINLPDTTSEGVEPVYLPLDIVFEDNYILVINKPPFMPVHPTKVHQQDTLANALKYYALNKGEDYAFRAVNRLDRNTSGLVIVTKDRHTAFALSESEIIKHYIAFAEGKIDENGTVNAPIELAPDSKIVRCVTPLGKDAVTHYEPIEQKNGFTVIKLALETGRTHQIRCHMSHIGHPLVGDDLYGGSLQKLNRHALHCGYISFTHPITGEKVEISVEIPEDMKGLL